MRLPRREKVVEMDGKKCGWGFLSDEEILLGPAREEKNEIWYFATSRDIARGLFLFNELFSVLDKAF